MPALVDQPATPRRKAGRPPRISLAMIADAAHEIGLERLTLKAVADRLGVSVAALYHHVSGKDELLRVAAERSTRAIPLPVDRGQSWAQWLMEWADYNRAVFSAQPSLLGQYLEGGIGPEVIVSNLDVILGVLVREGFSVSAADAAYSLVTACVLGMAVGARWEQAIGGTHAGALDAYRRVVEAQPKRRFPHVRRLLTARGTQPERSFATRIETVLRGIAAENDLPWRPLPR